jgi:hypothetical protein
MAALENDKSMEVKKKSEKTKLVNSKSSGSVVKWLISTSQECTLEDVIPNFIVFKEAIFL